MYFCYLLDELENNSYKKQLDWWNVSLQFSLVKDIAFKTIMTISSLLLKKTYEKSKPSDYLKTLPHSQKKKQSLHKKWSFPLRKWKFSRNCGFDHFYWKIINAKTSFFEQWIYFLVTIISTMYKSINIRRNPRIISRGENDLKRLKIAKHIIISRQIFQEICSRNEQWKCYQWSINRVKQQILMLCFQMLLRKYSQQIISHNLWKLSQHAI